MLDKLLGKHCSHETLGQLSNIRFSSSNLYGCTANIVEDEAQPKNIDIALIKRIIGGDPISVERKGEQGFDFRPYATMIFAMNDIVDFQSTDFATTSRFIVIPFNATFSKDNHNLNVNIGEQLCTPLCLQIFANMCILAFQQVMKHKHFIAPTTVTEATNSYFVESSPVVEYLSAREHPLRYEATSVTYEDFLKWCNDNSIEPLAVSVFGREMAHQEFKVERHLVDGVRKRFYVAKDYDPREDGSILFEDLSFMPNDSDVLEFDRSAIDEATENTIE